MVRPTNAIIAASVATLVTGFSWVSTPAPPPASLYRSQQQQHQHQQDPGSKGWAHVRLFIVTFVATFILVAVFQPSEVASPDSAAAASPPAAPAVPKKAAAAAAASAAAAAMSIDDVMQHVDLHKPPF
jgi:hypothetical protein